MDPRRLKEEFGGRIVFWGGGCDTQSVLWRDTPRKSPRTCASAWKSSPPAAASSSAPVHNVQANVPPENIIAMYDAVRRYGVSGN